MIMSGQKKLWRHALTIVNLDSMDLMDGLSLHYYTLPETEDNWDIKGSATDFDRRYILSDINREAFSWKNS